MPYDIRLKLINKFWAKSHILIFFIYPLNTKQKHNLHPCKECKEESVEKFSDLIDNFSIKVLHIEHVINWLVRLFSPTRVVDMLTRFRFDL